MTPGPLAALEAQRRRALDRARGELAGAARALAVAEAHAVRAEEACVAASGALSRAGGQAGSVLDAVGLAAAGRWGAALAYGLTAARAEAWRARGTAGEAAREVERARAGVAAADRDHRALEALCERRLAGRRRALERAAEAEEDGRIGAAWARARERGE